MKIKEPRTRKQPSGGGVMKGGRKIPSSGMRERPEGERTPLDDIIDGFAGIGDWIGENAPSIEDLMPKIPNPYTNPGASEKDIESLGSLIEDTKKTPSPEELKEILDKIGPGTTGDDAVLSPDEVAGLPEEVVSEEYVEDGVPFPPWGASPNGARLGFLAEALEDRWISSESNTYFLSPSKSIKIRWVGGDGLPNQGGPGGWFCHYIPAGGMIQKAPYYRPIEPIDWLGSNSAVRSAKAYRERKASLEKDKARFMRESSPRAIRCGCYSIDGNWFPYAIDYLDKVQGIPTNIKPSRLVWSTKWSLPPREGASPFPKDKNPRRRRRMTCCPEQKSQMDQLIKDIKLIKTWVGADNERLEVPRHPFMDTTVGFLGKVMGKGSRYISSLPDLIMYFIQAVDTMFGDEFPMRVDVPQHILDAAKKAGEPIASQYEMVTPGEAIRSIFEMVLNLQDDEENSRAIAIKTLLETYKTREEAYKSRNILEQFLQWSGIEVEEVKAFLHAEFTLPETDNDPNNSIKWEEWKKKYPNPDQELSAFLQPSKIAIKAQYFNPEKGRDLVDEFYVLRRIDEIVRAVHTVSLGKSKSDVKGKLTEYLGDFAAKAAYSKLTAPSEREKRGIGQDENDEAYDPKGLKNFRKFRNVVEDGLVSPTEKTEGTSLKSKKIMPYGRHPEETAEIRDITDK